MDASASRARGLPPSSGALGAEAQPVIVFPRDVVDRRGRRIRPGLAVVVCRGAPSRRIGEVTGWGGPRGVEVFLTDPDPELVAVPAYELEVVDVTLLERTTEGLMVVEDQRSVAVVVCVGAGDLRLRDPAAPGPFPAPAAHGSARDSRGWSEACLVTLAGFDRAERADTVAEHMDAPMIRALLGRAALPEVVRRLVFVVSQTETPARDDTAPLAELLAFWLAGTASTRRRLVAETAPPVVLPSTSGLDGVLDAVRARLSDILADCEEAFAVQTGGTPAMTCGVLLALSLYGGGRAIRHLDASGVRSTELNLPPVVDHRSAVAAAHSRLAGNDPAGAVAILSLLVGSPVAARALALAKAADDLSAPAREGVARSAPDSVAGLCRAAAALLDV